MAWRNPFFVFEHAYRDGGAGTVTSGPVAATGFPLSRVIDEQVGPLFKHNVAATFELVKKDRGAGTLFPIDRVLIPATHNITGTVNIQSDTDPNFGTPLLLLTGAITAGVLLDQSLTPNTERYIRIFITESGQWEYGEIWFGRDRTPTRGPASDFESGTKEPKISEYETEAGNTYRLQTGLPRGIFAFEFRRLSAADRAIFDDLNTQTNFGLSPFWWFGPDDTEPPVLVTLDAPIKVQNDSPNPRTLGPTYKATVVMRESLA